MRAREAIHAGASTALLIVVLSMICVRVALAVPHPVIHDYLPLQVGNSWTFVVVQGSLPDAPIGTKGILDLQRQKWCVTDAYDWNGYEVCRVENYCFGGIRGCLDLFNNGGSLFELTADAVGCWYDWDAQPYFPVEIPPLGDDCFHGSRGRAFASGPVGVRAGHFRETVTIEYYDRPCQDAGLVSETFAGGVGLIRRTELTLFGLRTWELEVAIVNGVVFQNTLDVPRTSPTALGEQGAIQDRTWGAIKSTFAE